MGQYPVPVVTSCVITAEPVKGGKRLGCKTTRGGNGLGAKRPGTLTTYLCHAGSSTAKHNKQKKTICRCV